MAYLNEFRGIGHVGSDPEVRNLPNGAMTATFRVALSRRFKGADGQQHEKTTWVTCVAWRKQAELVQRLVRKGVLVLVCGELDVRQWEDKNGGGKRYATEVVIDNFQLLDRKESTPDERRPSDFEDTGTQGSSDDDLPF